MGGCFGKGDDGDKPTATTTSNNNNSTTNNTTSTSQQTYTAPKPDPPQQKPDPTPVAPPPPPAQTKQATTQQQQNGDDDSLSDLVTKFKQEGAAAQNGRGSVGGEDNLDDLYQNLENEKKARRGTAIVDLEKLHTELVTSKRLDDGSKYTVDHEAGRVVQ